ncbi:ribonuclease inhibitor-like [Pseudorasbora parva]|uniref:ribonuclease inhibitor-like n=1 Tax=Pseudorasbora parva TaxID=51549 RepID=UPI00351E9077
MSLHSSGFTFVRLHTHQASHSSGFTLVRLHTRQASHSSGFTLVRLHTRQASHSSGFTLVRLHTRRASHSSGFTLVGLHTRQASHKGCRGLSLYLYPPEFVSPAADEACEYVRGIVGINPLLLRELNLRDHKLGDTRVTQISALLQDKHCRLNTLTLRRCRITEEQCLILTSALKSNPSHLRDLDLSGNKLGDSGVRNLSDLLMIPQCQLEKLHLRDCSITEEQCLILTSALRSNPSHLRDLDLSRNKLGDSGVKPLCDALKDSHCKLERLRLSCCDMTDEGCSAVTSALKSNPSHLRDLDLRGNKLGDSGVRNLSDLLMIPQCQLEKLQLYDCGITDVSSLTQSLRNSKALQFLKELDLRDNKIRDSQKQKLRDVIRDSRLKL